MESRIALLEETVSAIQTSVSLLRKLAEEHTSGFSDIRKYVTKTEEIEQLRAVAKAMQIQGFDGDEESIDGKEEKEEAGLISLEPKGKDVNNELEERKDECLSQLKEDDMSRSIQMQLADHYTLSDKQYFLEEPSQLADQSTLSDKQYYTEEQAQLKIFAELVSLSQLSAADKEALLKFWHVFETFQNEAKTMTDSIKELKKENELLKSKFETIDSLLVRVLGERMSLREQLEKTIRQKAALESLCRSLQAERKQSRSEDKKE